MDGVGWLLNIESHHTHPYINEGVVCFSIIANPKVKGLGALSSARAQTGSSHSGQLSMTTGSLSADETASLRAVEDWSTLR